MSHPSPAAVIVLAAGEGTRMRSATPKVLHAIGGRSLLGHVLTSARDLEPQRLAVVVRHEREAVAAHALELDPAATIADQDDVKGTGRAAWCALAALDAQAEVDGAVVVLAGDVPLLDAGTLGEMLAAHAADGNAVTVLTTRVPDPTGYGRIVRDADGSVLRIVEDRDADETERAIDEINTSVYAFDAAVLRAALTTLQDPASGATSNAQGEVYLTDVLALARATGPVRAIETDDPIIVEGVNDRVQLATLGAELNRRMVTAWMREGVTVVDPASTWVDVTVELARDVTLLPGVQLHGATTIGEGTTVGPDTTLRDSSVGAGASVVRSHVLGARIADGATVGPFAHLREGTDLGAGGKIGGFVETKNAVVGAGTKIPHLSYVGDAEIGAGANIGAGVILANYDGTTKSRTTIGDGAFVGSDSVLVAPLTIGAGAFVAAGSTVTRDVPAGDLAVERGQQKNLPDWVIRRRPGSRSARAATAARDQAAAAESSGADASSEPVKSDPSDI
ncbi:bifunctional UDP-N-acetylglucosamine diphosphorylase/glucosamine-1-phosphate N-acetyltransferase GlmU [Serinibacter arcticus]|uniref:Bifunctional protein GlmU n=1 Tax=Serinibacter arcticus TaxID=1655435 RepID=A0A2U1ZYB1_9MICO|nr:bifunctional UDP-N-acetylglucosamine diphosphorylase/glucosamine-1-phosphate N-acetyltransferase GlmU [Serinibacter arcticus]PWD51976.1 bifunctional UDP-N-acetylglucosamine diphosphorylase/glucosamine-1-phosphate N-acetyltransferase GlmU [Serinibacter arcticus]